MLHGLMRLHLRPALIVLFGIAFAAKALVPVGFMPDRAGLAKGVFQMTICSGMGLQQIIVDHNLQKIAPHHSPAKHDGKGTDVCPFGGLAFDGPVYNAIFFTLLSFVFLTLISRRNIGFLINYCNSAARSRAPPFVAVV